jgi:Na+-driven multidrug efflux pump
MNTTSILVSNYIGENSPQSIKLSIKYLLITGVFTQLPVLIAIYFFRENFYFFFSEEQSIYLDKEMMDYMIYLLVLTCAFDFIQSFLIGILRGCEILTFTTVASSVLLLVFHPIASSYMSLYLNWDISGVLISESFVYAALILLWTWYIVRDLDFNKICDEYQNEDHEDEEEEEIFKLTDDKVGEIKYNENKIFA